MHSVEIIFISSLKLRISSVRKVEGFLKGWELRASGIVGDNDCLRGIFMGMWVFRHLVFQSGAFSFGYNWALLYLV